MKSIFLYVLVLFLLAGCKQKERKIVAYCSNYYPVQASPAGEYLARDYYKSSKYYTLEPTDSISLKGWKSLMKKFKEYSSREKIGNIHIPPAKFNFCVYNQIVFYEENVPICFICISDKDNLISFNDDVYDITESGLNSIRQILNINCKNKEYVHEQSDAYSTRKEIKVIQ